MVYEAKHEETGQELALKVIDPAALDDPKARRRFEREVEAGTKIQSANIVRTLAFGTDEPTGLLWLTMERVRGRDLAAFLEASSPSPAIRYSILRQIFDAAAAAHDLAIVHRDLKPEHVLVIDMKDDPAAGAESPRVKILDFGIAKVVSTPTGRVTTAGLGTPLWTAPEQGKLGVAPRPNADVWALGLLVFYVLTGKMYWKHANDEAGAGHLALEIFQGALPAASSRARELGCEGAIPPGLDKWLARCLVRDPSRRFEDARVAFEALAPILGGTSAAPRGGRAQRASMALAVLALVVAVLVFIVQRR